MGINDCLGMEIIGYLKQQNDFRHYRTIRKQSQLGPARRKETSINLLDIFLYCYATLHLPQRPISHYYIAYGKQLIKSA